MAKVDTVLFGCIDHQRVQIGGVAFEGAAPDRHHSIWVHAAVDIAIELEIERQGLGSRGSVFRLFPGAETGYEYNQ
jgi:hypothetical protein